MYIRQDVLLDQNNAPIVGAQIYVYVQDGLTNSTLATLTSDGTTPLANPVISDAFGNFKYYANTGFYIEDIWFGGKRVWKNANEAVGSPGADLNLRSDLAANTGFTLLKYKSGHSNTYARTAANWAQVGGADDDNVFNFIDPSLDAALIAQSNTADLLTYFQNGMNSGIGRMVVPSFANGTIYRLNGTLVMPGQFELVGTGQWSSFIRSDNLSAPIITSSNTANSAIRNLSLSYNGTPLSGANAVALTTCQTWSLTDLWVPSAWEGIRLEGGGNHTITNYRCYSYENAALHLKNITDVILTAFRFHAGDSIKGRQGGIWLEGGVEAFEADNGDVTLGIYGLSTSNTGSSARGSAPYFNRFTNVYFDSANKQCAYLRSLFHTDFNACWYGSAGHDNTLGYNTASNYAGIDIAGCSHLRFVGGEAYNCGGQGALVDATSPFVRFGGAMSFKRNGLSRASSTPGIEFAAGATDFAVTGCMFEKDADTTTYKMDTAVKVDTGASDRYFVADNLLGGTTVSDGGSGANKRVANNY